MRRAAMIGRAMKGPNWLGKAVMAKIGNEPRRGGTTGWERQSRKVAAVMGSELNVWARPGSHGAEGHRSKLRGVAME